MSDTAKTTVTSSFPRGQIDVTTCDEYQQRREAEFSALYAVRLAAEALLAPASDSDMRRWRRKRLAEAVAAAKALDPTEATTDA